MTHPADIVDLDRYEEQRRALVPLLYQIRTLQVHFGNDGDDRHLAPGIHLTWGEWRRILEAFEE